MPDKSAQGTKSTVKIMSNIFIAFLGAGVLGLPFAFKEVCLCDFIFFFTGKVNLGLYILLLKLIQTSLHYKTLDIILCYHSLEKRRLIGRVPMTLI